MVLLALAGLAIVLLSAPAERHLYLTGELDRFTLPNTVELELDHPRQLAVMHSLVRFANVAANGGFTT